ncbi:MAG: hypothetical protein ACPHN2_18065 [Sinimarinibacterium flocculans]|nr:hypothetical protein [Pseudomonadota bacterium]
MKSRPVLEILLLIALPLAVLFAGVLTTVLAHERGFTPLPAQERLVGTR